MKEAVFQRVSRGHGCTCVFVCVCSRLHMHVCIHVCSLFRSECCMHCGTGVLGTSACAGEYFTQVFFDINVHICQTLAAGCAHMCMCIYMCICMHTCIDTYVRL